MAFVFGVVTFVLGAALVAVSLFAIPGPPSEGDALGHGEKPDPTGRGHGHGGH